MAVRNFPYRWLLIGLFCVFSGLTIAQETHLDHPVTLAVKDQPVAGVLKRMEMRYGFHFSYNAQHFPSDSLVSFDATEVPLSQVLLHIFGDNLQMVESGRHIILIRKRPPTRKDIRKGNVYMISGYIRNTRTGEAIQKASIYQVGNNEAVLTNKDGYYELEIEVPRDAYSSITYSRRDFVDTVIVIKPLTDQQVDILLKPYPPKLSGIDHQEAGEIPVPTLDTLGLVKLLVKDELFEQTHNLFAVEEQALWQASVLPNVGTNGSLGGLTTNQYSFNLFAGYAYGLNGVELGGLVNILRADMRGVQLGGIGNVTGGEVRGVQIGGLFNNNLGAMRGVQLAGVANVLRDSLTGVQIAGISNFSALKIDGYQVSGISNLCLGDVDGFQLAGISNIARGDVNIVQASGISNIANNVNGAQLSGISNIARDTVHGIQLAGITNRAGTVHTAQISVFANIADRVDGLQLGLYNFTDTIHGVPIGLFSHVSTGLHQFEIAYCTTLQGQLDYRTGIHQFHNILSGGVHFNGAEPMIAMGYGFGTEWHLRKWGIGLDAIGYRQETTALQFDRHDWLATLRLNLSRQLGNSKMRMVFGPTIDAQFTNRLDGDTNRPLYPSYPYEGISTYRHGLYQSFWIGGRLALRL